MLLAKNVPARVVMEMLGHSQISLTLDTYTHVSRPLQREAATQMGDFMRSVMDGEEGAEDVSEEGASPASSVLRPDDGTGGARALAELG